jgi:hypothetical protein
VRLDDFRSLVRRQAEQVPPEFLDGVLEVVVSRRALAHPSRAGIFTLGECIPVPTETAGPDGIQSRVVLYHGSFAALASQGPGFDWAGEAWETLAHELRHHVEWRASAPDLEAFDLAAEHNFARVDGERFDPEFYRDGERPAPGVFRIDDDVFLEETVRQLPAVARFEWRGAPWRAAVPTEATLPAFLVVEGVDAPPSGDLVVVLRQRASLLDLIRRRGPPPFQATVTAEPDQPE